MIYGWPYGRRKVSFHEMNPSINELCMHYRYHDDPLVRKLIKTIESIMKGRYDGNRKAP